MKEAKTMSEKNTDMLKALRGSVESIMKAPEGERDALLTKSFGEYEEALNKSVAAATDEAFAMGQQGQIVEFSKVEVEGDPELAKSMSAVATFANVLRSVEYAIKDIQGMYPQVPVGGGAAEPAASPEAVAAMAEWLKMGASILAMLVAEFTNEAAEDAAEAAAESGEDAAKADTAEDLKKADGEFTAKREDVLTLAKSLAEKVERFEALFKAEPEPDAPGEQPGAGKMPEQTMDPLEVIGRLAAAILVQVENLMPGDEGEEETPAEPAAPAAEAPAPTVDKDATAQKSEPTGDLAKAGEPPKAADPVVDPELAKRATDLEKENESLKEKLAKAEADKRALAEKPEAPKGTLRAVDKSADDPLGKNDEADLVKEAERLAKMAPEQRAIELTKLALRKPINIG